MDPLKVIFHGKARLIRKTKAPRLRKSRLQYRAMPRPANELNSNHSRSSKCAERATSRGITFHEDPAETSKSKVLANTRDRSRGNSSVGKPRGKRGGKDDLLRACGSARPWLVAEAGASSAASVTKGMKPSLPWNVEKRR